MTMRRPLLIQPPSHGRISGGFLYNARMASSGLWEVLDIPANDLPTLEERIAVDAGPVLMDSIWLTPAHASVFLALQGRGRRVGSMLHSFPSMIEATESGRAPVTWPSAFELDVLEQLDVVVVPGSHYRDLLAGARATVVVAEPGIDDAWRAPPRRRSGPCRLVSVGAVTPRKGLLDVVEMLHSRGRANDDFTWSAVGSLEVDRDYAQRVLEVGRRVPSATLCGQLTPEATRHIVQHSDVFLMPSYDENQPLVLLEAMAASVPSVVYAAGAARHMLEHGRQGFVTDIGDKAAFARHVFQLIDDEGLRSAMALACWDRQKTLPNWPTAARRARAELERELSD